MAVPDRLKFKRFSNDEEIDEDKDISLGALLDLKVDGRSTDTSGSEETGLLIRAFYRVDGVPHSVILYNGLAAKTANVREFTSGNIGQFFRPAHIGRLSITAIAWDHKVASKTDADFKKKKVLLRVQ